MAESYIGEIRMFAGNFAPAGWAFCSGQLMPISEYGALFSLIGTTYGGDGQQTFALPDLQGRLPMHQGNGTPLGTQAGVEQVTLSTTQIPAHTHQFSLANTPSQNSPSGRLLANPGRDVFIDTTPNAPLAPQAIDIAGGDLPHENMQPYLCVSFIISLFGNYPSQS
jgi:microcystin-dependent protein